VLGRGFFEYYTQKNECIIILLEFHCHIAMCKDFLGAWYAIYFTLPKRPLSFVYLNSWSPDGGQMGRWMSCSEKWIVFIVLFNFQYFQNVNLILLLVCCFRLWFISWELLIWTQKKSCLQCPPTFEERESLTSNDGTNASLNAGFLVGLNLEASVPDTFQPPPVPLPYDTVLGGSASTTYSESGRETISSFEALIAREDVEESNCKAQTNSTPTSPRKEGLPKPNESKGLPMEEEDVCPICLEGRVACVIKSKFQLDFPCFRCVNQEEEILSYTQRWQR